MYRIIALAAALVVTSQPASASTPGEWAKLEWRAKQSCMAASNYRRPSVSNPAVFNDRVGIVAMLVSGTYRQAHMKAAKGTSLCLFNRKLGTAVVEEVTGWGETRPSEQPW